MVIEEDFKSSLVGLSRASVNIFVLCYTEEHLNKLVSAQKGWRVWVQSAVITVSHYEISFDLFKRQASVHQLAPDAELRKFFPVDTWEATSAGQTDEHLLEDTVVASKARFAFLQILDRFNEVLQFHM